MMIQKTNNGKCKGRILKYAIIIFFLNRLFALEVLNYYPIIDEVYVLISETLTIWFCLKFVYIHNKNGHLYTNEVGVVFLVLIYFAYVFMDTLFQEGSIRRVLMTAYPIIGSLCFVEVESRNHYDELVRGFNLFFCFFVIVNLLDMIFIRHALIGLTTTTFLVGGKNQLAILLAVALAFFCVVRQKQDKEKRFWDLCNGGKIQYVKYPIDYNMQAFKTLLKRAMRLGFYEGVNLSLSYCDDCGHEELNMDVCPKCGSKNLTKIDRMNGYLSYSRVKGDTRLNDAKMAEIADRKSM